MNPLDILHQQLSKANVADEEISRGIRLTARGEAKLARLLNVTTDDLHGLLSQLASKLKAEIAPTGLPASPAVTENDERFAYEADTLGNVMLRDTKTGAEHYLQGNDGQKFLHEIDRAGTDFQSLIAPYFDHGALHEEADIGADFTGQTGGTYNFPYKGNFACALFWLDGNKPQIKVMSVVDDDGEEINLDAAEQAEVDRVAWEWVNKV